jgi:arylsulfatase A-like enzyme
MAEDTVVIYLADNGWVQRLQGTTPLENAIGDDDGKASIHNRGLQSPIIVRWPREVSPGRTSHRLVTFEDVYATILDYAGVERPDCTDGHSFRRIADNGRGRWRRHTVYAESEILRVPFAELADGAFFLRSEYGQFVRTRRWAYNDFEDRGTEELFDLRKDPLGLVDVSDAHPRKLRLLRRRAERAARRLARRSCPVD